MVDRRRITAGQALLALGLLVAGVALGRLTAGVAGGDDGAVGPTRNVDGVPVGYARSPQGAAAAAINYAIALDRPELYLDPTRLERAVQTAGTQGFASQFATPGARAAFTELREGPLGTGLRRGTPTIYKSAYLGYEVVSYTDDEASVRGWGVQVVGNPSRLRPSATWGMATSTVRWVDGDWRLASVREERAPTPAPAPNSRASDGRSFVQLASGLRGLRYAP